MDRPDELVIHLLDRLLNPCRLAAMLASLASRRAAKAAAMDELLTALEATERLQRLHTLLKAVLRRSTTFA
jgi:hypothetical protein